MDSGRTAGEQRGGAAAASKQRIVEAALELYETDGYDSTTIDAIARRAGVSRRSFFHHFPTKDSVVFSDHAALIARVETYLADRASAEPLEAVEGALTMVLEQFTSHPETAIRRYELVRATPELRTSELAWVHRYQVVFSRFLRAGYGGRPHGDVIAEMTAAALVAAHNNVLRVWLTSGATTDPVAQLANAVAQLGHVPGAKAARQDSRVVVAVFDESTDASAVLDAVRTATRRR